MNNANDTKPNHTTGEIIEARQALFFIGIILTVYSIYKIAVDNSSFAFYSLIFSITALALGYWSKTNPVSAFRIGFFISIFFVLISVFNVFTLAISGIFSFTFYRGWKYAKSQNLEVKPSSREDILDSDL